MAKNIFIGFDFSMNKPAATLLYDKQFHFFIWPAEITKKNIQTYESANVHVFSRDLKEVKTSNLPNSQIVLEHTRRSTDLANLIIKTLDNFIDNELHASDTLIYISSEGLSYNSTGDAALNLATYKGVLLSKLYEHYFDRLKGLYTYPPITMKSVAGCAKKGQLADKNKMIKAFTKEPINSIFKDMLLQGKFMAKTNFIKCVDDICDSYWAVKTLLVKENFIKG